MTCALAVWLWAGTYAFIGLLFTVFVLSRVLVAEWSLKRKVSAVVVLSCILFPLWLLWFALGVLASVANRKDMRAQLRKAWDGRK